MPAMIKILLDRLHSLIFRPQAVPVPVRVRPHRSLLLFALLCLVLPVFGQRYKTAFGLRVGDGINLTLQQHVYDKWTVEGILHSSIGSKSAGFTVLGEQHHKILMRGINLYWGAGGHYYAKDGVDESGDPIKNIAGLSAIAGGEISVGRINVSIDWKPELHFNSVDAFDWNGAAVSVRYILVKRERKGIDDWKVWDKFKGNKKSKRK